MDELKNGTQTPQNSQNSQNGQGGQGGGRRRRRKHRKGGGGAQNTQNPQNTQNAKNQVAQNPQNNRNNPKPQQPQQPKQNNQPQQPKKQKPPKNNGGNNAKQSADKSKRKDVYAYTLDGNLYINLTNKCSNGCDFCVRNERDTYYGYNLWLQNDVTAEKVIAALNGGQVGSLSQYKEAVFCGFGEPTYKLSEMLNLCDFFHARGLKTRLNTNGQGNLINKRDITPDLKDKIDLVNVSLNASCAEKYQPMCRSQFGESAFAAIVEFAKLCRKNGVNCRFSIVDCIGEEEVEACKRLAESVKIPLYVREYLTDSE
jgi:TatD family-associated radical SAM protein